MYFFLRDFFIEISRYFLYRLLYLFIIKLIKNFLGRVTNSFFYVVKRNFIKRKSLKRFATYPINKMKVRITMATLAKNLIGVQLFHSRSVKAISFRETLIPHSKR